MQTPKQLQGTVQALSHVKGVQVGMACWVWGPGTHEGLQLELEHNWRSETFDPVLVDA